MNFWYPSRAKELSFPLVWSNSKCDFFWQFHMEIFNYFDTAIVFVIPFTTIVILNTYTALAVWKVAGVRRTMTIQTRYKWNHMNLYKESWAFKNPLENQTSEACDRTLIFTISDWIIQLFKIRTLAHKPVRKVRNFHSFRAFCKLYYLFNLFKYLNEEQTHLKSKLRKCFCLSQPFLSASTYQATSWE